MEADEHDEHPESIAAAVAAPGPQETLLPLDEFRPRPIAGARQTSIEVASDGHEAPLTIALHQ